MKKILTILITIISLNAMEDKNITIDVVSNQKKYGLSQNVFEDGDIKRETLSVSFEFKGFVLGTHKYKRRKFQNCFINVENEYINKKSTFLREKCEIMEQMRETFKEVKIYGSCGVKLDKNAFEKCDINFQY